MDSKVIRYIILVFILFIISIVFSLINIGNEKILKNTYIQNLDVSKMSQNEAEEYINKEYREKKLKQIILKHNDYETAISFDQLNVDLDTSKAVGEAYGKGRTGNIVTNNYTILFSYFYKKNISLNINLDGDALGNVVKDIESKLPDVKTESSYYIDGENLIIKKGTIGVQVKQDELKQKITDVINDIKDKENIIEIPVEEVKPKEINIDKIASEIKKEAKDAYISENPLEIHIEQNGIELAISTEEAKKILKEDKEEYTIPLKITEPTIKVASLGDRAFTDKIATFSTSYDASNINRNNNLVLAAQKLNGTIVNPNDSFSYNKTIGERTISAGFKEAKAYANGDIVLDVGGGICQLSSTLYNTVLLANLNVTERHSHYFKTSYVAAGRDATVSWGSVDFQFENNRKYPIKIEAVAGEGVVTVNLWGIKQEDDCTVVIDSKETSIIERTVEKVNNKSQEREGEDGCTSETYKTLLKGGVVVSKSLISKDTYNALSKKVCQ
ncbi:MAG: VanW family protein [Clostridia bacterium]|nr:VanW family protein [Clostridia bacterium]